MLFQRGSDQAFFHNCLVVWNKSNISYLIVCVCWQANSVMDMIGFPAYILNTTALDDRYKEVRHVEKLHVHLNIYVITLSDGF